MLAQQRKKPCSVAAFGLVALALSGAAHGEWYGKAIDLMGTRVSVELWDEREAEGLALVERVLDEYRRIDFEMSTYKPESSISAVNAHAAERPVPVSAF